MRRHGCFHYERMGSTRRSTWQPEFSFGVRSWRLGPARCGALKPDFGAQLGHMLGAGNLASLYLWLTYLHLLGFAVFLLGHGISAGCSLVLRRPLSDPVRANLLELSSRGNFASLPGLGLLLVTGVWMGFLGSWWHWGWIWAAIIVLVAVTVAMSAQSLPYHKARDVIGGSEAEGELESELKHARPLVMAVIGTVGLVVLIFLMLFKPF